MSKVVNKNGCCINFKLPKELGNKVFNLKLCRYEDLNCLEGDVKESGELSWFFDVKRKF